MTSDTLTKDRIVKLRGMYMQTDYFLEGEKMVAYVL